MQSAKRVKEIKRQGRIAHHHTDATVPHIVALLDFSFHAANIQCFPLTSKQFHSFFTFPCFFMAYSRYNKKIKQKKEKKLWRLEENVYFCCKT